MKRTTKFSEAIIEKLSQPILETLHSAEEKLKKRKKKTRRKKKVQDQEAVAGDGSPPQAIVETSDHSLGSNAVIEEHVLEARVEDDASAFSLRADIVEYCKPEVKLVNFGPFIHFRAVNADDIAACGRMRLLGQHRALARAMYYSPESGFLEKESDPSALPAHVSDCCCERCVRAKRIRAQNVATAAAQSGAAAPTKLLYKMCGARIRLIVDLLETNGFASTQDNNFTVLWSSVHLKAYYYKSLTRTQRVNLFPHSWECTRKDALARNVNRMAQLHGARHFRFMPECYVLPQERDLILHAMLTGGPDVAWIVKPAGSSQGRGIYIIRGSQAFHELPANSDDNWIVERYIQNPQLLDGGRKFDLRLYIAVTSFYPLKIYLHDQGLCRFATEAYNVESLDDPYSHLTNYSINKANVDRAGASAFRLKWSLSELNAQLESQGIDVEKIWLKIKDLIIKTLISVESKICNAISMFVPYPETCFELFGFDVLIDETHNPWLLEVNFSPSMNTDSDLDLSVKANVVADIFTLVGVRTDAFTAVPPSSTAAMAAAGPSGASKIYRNRAVGLPAAPITSRTIGAQIPAPARPGSAPKTKARRAKVSLPDSGGDNAPMPLAPPQSSAFNVLDSMDIADERERKLVQNYAKELDRARLGGFSPIYPCADASKYFSFFEEEKRANVLLAQYAFFERHAESGADMCHTKWARAQGKGTTA